MRNHELAIFILGIFTSSATLQTLTGIARRSWIFQALFFLAVGTQISTQGIQFSNALLVRKELDRKSGFVLYAYTERDMVLLNTIAADEPYMIGYRYFRDGQYEKAKPFLEKSYREGKYVAQSHYLLATIVRKQNGDLSEAKAELTAAINYDDQYSAAYYGRAILEVDYNKEFRDGLDDLTRATSYGVIECFDINDPREVRDVWSTVALDPTFQKLQLDCRRRHPEIAKDTFQD